VSNKFDYFAHGLGLQDYQSLQLDSPFDFKRQTLLFVPDSFPEPNSDAYLDAVVDTARQVIKYSQGRAFLLFTSFRALNYSYEKLKDEITQPLLVQGQASRDILLDRFRHAGNAVLLGTNSFWEGVDVRGEALVCVLIDKLPFAAPNDPVLQARLDAMRDKGMNPFMQYQLPMAVIMLKQGVGRLIRDEQDYGVLVLCDPRLKTKSYGKTFLNSLPQMTRTSQWQDVKQFYEMQRQKQAVIA
jgi:ATP-dependent DNA helicase DinG